MVWRCPEALSSLRQLEVEAKGFTDSGAKTFSQAVGMGKELSYWDNLVIKELRCLFIFPTSDLFWNWLACLYSSENRTQGSR